MKYIARTILQLGFFILIILKVLIIAGVFLHKITLNNVTNLTLYTLLFILIILYAILYPVKRYEYGINIIINLNNNIVKFIRKKIVILLDIAILILFWLSQIEVFAEIL